MAPTEGLFLYVCCREKVGLEESCRYTRRAERGLVDSAGVASLSILGVKHERTKILSSGDRVPPPHKT